MPNKPQAIQLDIPAAARALMLGLSLVHVVGIFAYFQILVVRGDHSHQVLSMALLGLFCLPFSAMLMSIPALLRRYPSWVVRVFGKDYLVRLASEADLAWAILTKSPMR